MQRNPTHAQGEHANSTQADHKQLRESNQQPTWYEAQVLICCTIMQPYIYTMTSGAAYSINELDRMSRKLRGRLHEA